jgi:Fungal specific transcription factor domain
MFEPGKKSERLQEQERSLVIRDNPPATISTSPFSTPAESQSFQFYLEKTAHLISIYSQRHFWTTIIPQATHQHTSVKHSVLALSILHESLASHDGLTKPDNARLLKHYNSAIRALTQTQPSTDVVLITSLLFWTVENFNGTGRPSFDHLEAAQKILREFKAKTDHTESPYYELINRYLEPIILDAVQHARTPGGQSATDEIAERGTNSDLLNTLLPVRLPTVFPEPAAAQEHLSTCIRALLYIMNHEVAEIEVRDCLERIEAHLRRWLYLFHNLTAVGTAWNRRMLVIHHVNAMALCSDLKASLGFEIEDENELQSQYKWTATEMDEMIAQRLDLPPPAPPCEHDLGLIPPLFSAALRCTDPAIKTKSLENLKQMDGEEGCWKGLLAAKIAEELDLAYSENKVGLRFNNVLLYQTNSGLGMYSKDPNFDRLLEGADLKDCDAVRTPSIPR